MNLKEKKEDLTKEKIKKYFDNTFIPNDFSNCVFIETLKLLENKYNLSFENDIERIKRIYTIGTRIKLNYMSDDYGVESGTLGTVDFVDDEGQIHMNWDNGRTLALIPNLDNFEIVEKNLNNDMEVKI